MEMFAYLFSMNLEMTSGGMKKPVSGGCQFTLWKQSWSLLSPCWLTPTTRAQPTSMPQKSGEKIFPNSNAKWHGASVGVKRKCCEENAIFFCNNIGLKFQVLSSYSRISWRFFCPWPFVNGIEWRIKSTPDYAHSFFFFFILFCPLFYLKTKTLDLTN